MELLKDALDDKELVRRASRELAEQKAKALGLRSSCLTCMGTRLHKRSLFSTTAYAASSQDTLAKVRRLSCHPRSAREMDYRLVPNQDPNDILEKLEKHLMTKFLGHRSQAREPRLPGEDSCGTTHRRCERICSCGLRQVHPVVSPTQGGSGPMYLDSKNISTYLLFPSA